MIGGKPCYHTNIFDNMMILNRYDYSGITLVTIVLPFAFPLPMYLWSISLKLMKVFTTNWWCNMKNIIYIEMMIILLNHNFIIYLSKRWIMLSPPLLLLKIYYQELHFQKVFYVWWWERRWFWWDNISIKPSCHS